MKEIKTYPVLLTKTDKEELKEYYTKLNQIYEARFQPYLDMVRSACDSLVTNNPYAKHNWRKGLAKRLYKTGHEWNRIKDENEITLYEWITYAKRDLRWCVDEFKWDDAWVQPTFQLIDRCMDSLNDTQRELLWRDEQLWSLAKHRWEKEDATWITRNELKKSHESHKPKSFYIELFKTDKDAEKWYDGVVPDNEDTCEFCIEEKRIDQEREEKMRLEEEQQEQEEEELRLERRKLAEEKERQKQSVELVKQHCEVCDYTTHHGAIYQIHLTSKPHLINVKKQGLYCKTCDHQSRTEIEHAHHLSTTKHKRNTGVVAAEPDEYSCESCEYTTHCKQHYENHLKSKKHKKNVDEKST